MNWYHIDYELDQVASKRKEMSEDYQGMTVFSGTMEKSIKKASAHPSISLLAKQ